MRIGNHGYVVLNGSTHPLAVNGQVLEHRVVLYDALAGADTTCHWCDKNVYWQADTLTIKLLPDHLDFNKTNNEVDNLVPSCIECNNRRTPNNPTARMKICLVEGCESKHLSKGLCSKHYARLTRFGSLNLKGRGKPPKHIGCVIENCEAKHHARGYCSKHYMTDHYIDTRKNTKNG